MTTEQIAKFFSVNKNQEVPVRISFKTRNNVIGIFIKTPDFDELKSKNFWRIVPQSQLEAYKSSKNANLAKIFNGAEFSRLATYQESFD